MVFRWRGRGYCAICGSRMVVFRYPTRYQCPTPGRHPAIIADQKGAMALRGRKNPGARGSWLKSPGNLRRKRRKKK
jgi:hypothetical protein